ncbi:MAG TPA: ABC transporter ATP-binding protein [Chitinophaga sp.]|uniref:ABC transporter ATP-binding protein n=1 Tax=Chitinophaga sp. TaxID=1869181 RepID=UPI002CBB1BCA|nr:ABC transporter ATP-binding protein [Chitinophaga sp.]HVI45614.1 ABC transporter ATP-binding protein [Chitinophaga sp.]
MEHPIIVEGVSKHFGAQKALQDISFEVKPAELFGLIGPDGAGKSTLFRILTTLLLADKGRAVVAGMDVVKQYKAIRRHVGYMPGRFSLYQDLSVEENLHFFATIFNTTITANYDLIKDIYEQIQPFKDRPAGKLSGGMKQKLALCCALVHKPVVLFLDEPTTGVDPVSRKEFWEMLKGLREKGIPVLVSTPYMDEAVLCDRVALIQDGSILEIDTPQHIINRFRQPIWAAAADNMFRLLTSIRAFPQTASCYAFGDSLHVTLQHGEADLPSLKAYLDGQQQPYTIKPITASIEDCFMALSA